MQSDAITCMPPGERPFSFPETPMSWRLGIAAGVGLFTVAAYVLRDVIGPRGQACIGVLCFMAIVAMFSTNLRAVNWRTIGWGIALQWLLVFFILKFEVLGYRPGYELFRAVSDVITQFVTFADQGARFVFGPLADPEALGRAFGKKNGFVFAFAALPTIIFVSSFFTVLYYFGVLQLIVRVMARVMMYLMGTSGAETLSAAANVFMGQTEAPLIVKPYVTRMTQSELLALMVGGLATVSGGIMVVYIKMGADPIAILATSVMAAPCGLYLSKLLYPETEKPETAGRVHTEVEQSHRNVIDAAAAGASDGMTLAINVAAMLVAFIAFIACLNYLLGLLGGWLITGFSLEWIFSRLFAPVAMLMGIEGPDIPHVADLLGIKLVGNEFLAYAKLTEFRSIEVNATVAAQTVGFLGVPGGGPLLAASSVMTPQPGAGLWPGTRSYILVTYALTGFANFASVGIQLGGIGGMAPNRRGDLARLGGRALLAGFVATLINAAIAGILM